MPFLNIAHRGLHTEYPENSLEAFIAAWNSGCDMVEFDIQLSKDGVPVVFHDDDLKRMCGVDKAVYECSVLELQSYPLLDSKACIPTFQEFMNIGFGRPHYFEIKVPEAQSKNRAYKEKLVDTVYHLLNNFQHLKTSYVSSFDLEILEIIDERVYYTENLVVTFEFPQEIEHYATATKRYPYKSYCWDYLVKQDPQLVDDPACSFLWAIVEPEDYTLLKLGAYLGLISDEPHRFIS